MNNEFTQEQLKGFSMAKWCDLTGRVAVVTGGPGTGKTTSINCIIRLMRRMGRVELCAPTGRAVF